MPSFPGSTADNVELARLDGTRPFTGDVAMGAHKITGIQDAVAPQDAPSLSQIQGLIAAGVSTVADWKQSVRAATTANITLSAAQTIDGVSVIAGDRVLVKNQSTGSQNGIYVVAAGAWTRATDADVSAEVTTGLTVVVEEGTAAAGKPYILTTANPITLGTTALTFTQLSSVTAGNGLTGTSSLAVLPEDTTITVGAAGVKRPAITGDVSIPAGSNVAAIGAGVIVAADINSAAAIEKTKLENSAACSFVGNPTNSSGPLSDVALGTNGFVALRRSNALIGGLLLNENVDPAAGIVVTKLAPSATNGRVLVTIAGVNTWSTSLGNSSDAMLINGVDARVQTSGVTTLHAVTLSSRVILGLFGVVSATEMPANTGDRVAHIHDASAMPTTGFPTSGGIIGCDEFLGLGWKGKNGVETTIAPHGDSGNTTKRRMISWKSQPVRTSIASAAQFTASSIDCASLNGMAAAGMYLHVRAKFLAAGSYFAYGEADSLFVVDGSNFPSNPPTGNPQVSGFDGSAGVIGGDNGGYQTWTIDTSGTTIRFRVTPNTGTRASEYISWFEVDGFEP